MPEHAQGDSSDSFLALQRIQASFDEASSLGRSRQKALQRLAVKLGGACIRLCLRELSHVDEHVERSRWASVLLAHLATSDRHRDKVIDALERLVDGRGSESARLRALGLLSELGRALPVGTSLAPLTENLERSIEELSSVMTSASGVALAGDMLVRRLPPHEMLALVEALSVQEPPHAFALLSELLLRNDLHEPARRALKQLRAALREHCSSGIRPPSEPVATATIGRHGSGRQVVVAWRKTTTRGAGEYRVLSMQIDASGALIEGDYREDLAAARVQQEVLVPLQRQGFSLDTVSCRDAARRLIDAARAASHVGRILPRSFYLGRDLLDIFDQHVMGLSPEDDLPALLERAFGLTRAGQPERARPLFERFVAQCPDNVDGRAGLANCLLALDDERGALEHLHRALELDGDNPNHHWNLAAIAYQQGRSGECYRELVDYLALAGDCDGAPGDSRERRHLAEAFVIEYERIAQVEYPSASAQAVADIDDSLMHAWRLVRGEQYDCAIEVLERALKGVSEHYPALTCLGVAYLESGRLESAQDVLIRALRLRSGFPLARETLARVRSLLAMSPAREQSTDVPGKDAERLTDRHPQMTV